MTSSMVVDPAKREWKRRSAVVNGFEEPPQDGVFARVAFLDSSMMVIDQQWYELT